MQLPLDGKIQCFNEIRDRIVLLFKNVGRNISISIGNILYAPAGCEEQNYHYDFDPKNCNTFKSYFIVVALQKDTLFNVRANPTVRTTRLKLSKGDVLIGRGDLLHAGAHDFDSNF